MTTWAGTRKMRDPALKLLYPLLMLEHQGDCRCCLLLGALGLGVVGHGYSEAKGERNEGHKAHREFQERSCRRLLHPLILYCLRLP